MHGIDGNTSGPLTPDSNRESAPLSAEGNYRYEPYASEAEGLEREWRMHPRWKGIIRPYSAADMLKLRGSLHVEHTLARHGADRLWHMLMADPFVRTLGAMTGLQAVQQVQAGLTAIYVSGWQAAVDANSAGQTYPDEGLYPADSVPALVRRINNALQRADQISHVTGEGGSPYWFAPIVADAETGFGGPLNTFELMKALIEAGAAGVAFDDQTAGVRKGARLGGKVLVPAQEFIDKLIAARLAADVMGVATMIVARTDAESAALLATDIDPRDQPFLSGERTTEGYYRARGGLQYAIARALTCAPYADVLWFETSEPNIAEARHFAQAIHAAFPEKMLAYNCSPSFNWRKELDTNVISVFQDALGALGYRFQFVTLAGFHALNHSMFALAHDYAERGMAAYADFQQGELSTEQEHGFRAARHQAFVGTGYFDQVTRVITGANVAAPDDSEQ